LTAQECHGSEYVDATEGKLPEGFGVLPNLIQWAKLDTARGSIEPLQVVFHKLLLQVTLESI
jgi:hypothetical protein